MGEGSSRNVGEANCVAPRRSLTVRPSFSLALSRRSSAGATVSPIKLYRIISLDPGKHYGFFFSTSEIDSPTATIVLRCHPIGPLVYGDWRRANMAVSAFHIMLSGWKVLVVRLNSRCS